MIYNLIHRKSKQSTPYSLKCLKCIKHDIKHLFTDLACDNMRTAMMFAIQLSTYLNYILVYLESYDYN